VYATVVGAIEVERSLHESFFASFGLSEKDVAAEPIAPTTVASGDKALVR